MSEPDRIPFSAERRIEEASVASDVKMPIMPGSAMSIIVTGNEAEVKRSSPRAARCARNTEVVMPPAQAPITLSFSEPVISEIASLASVSAVT